MQTRKKTLSIKWSKYSSGCIEKQLPIPPKSHMELMRWDMGFSGFHLIRTWPSSQVRPHSNHSFKQLMK